MSEVTVRVKYLINFLDITGKREETPAFPAGADLQTLAGWLKSSYGITVPAPGSMALLNGRGWGQYPLGMSTPLKEGDTVILMPSISGG